MEKKLTSYFNKNTFKKFYTDYSFILSFVVLLGVALIFNPKFLSYSSMMTLLSNATITGIVACGMTLVIISGMIDLSVGSVVSLVAGISVLLLNQTNDVMLTLVFCILFGAILGAINGVLVSYIGIAAFIATLATMSAYRSIITQIGQGGPFTVNKDILGSFSPVATGKLFGSIPFLPLFLIGVVLLIGFLLANTKFGRYVYATGSNEHATILAGIKTKNVKMVVFIIIGALCGLSAFLLASRMSSVTASNAGFGYELDAIAAVAIGGTSMSGGRGRITGTFLGALMMQMISVILIAAKIDPFLNGLVKGIIIIVAVTFQSKSRSNV